ncbi:phosphoglycerate mutase-like protein [Pholiota conissans]|uniref:Phosphoglycerate mutase-like protein n=1 Tax=Pholiota conissans TaxID=109636 RepID=A0A9P6CWJ1_9AGAR|nr:phosphoglycerate mutase-like protein [Pholiota conissans]
MQGSAVFIATIAASAEIIHYPPAATNLNNLTFVLNGSGAPGIFNSSVTPNAIYGTYNWCNMPHVRQREYKTPPKNYTLQYVEVIQRHHKRTPYASNTFFKEDVTWSCDGSGAVFGGTSLQSQVLPVQWQAFTDAENPWTTTVGPGFVGSTCQFPQITGDGLQDSITHGSDLRTVYASRLGLHSNYDTSQAQIRVTNNVITSQVASGLLAGLFPHSNPQFAAVKIQSSNFDSLEPTYSCPTASNLRSQYTTGSAGQQWQAHLSGAAPLYAKLDAVSGIAPNDNGGWHTSFDHYYDNLSAKLCHQKKLPCSLNDTSLCITLDEANTVFRLGNWEYSYQFRDAPASAQYSALRYGAWVLELRSHLQAKVDGSSKLKYFHNVAHDGSMSPLLGFLQVDQMVWPGMGSEIVFELYSAKAEHFIRVLWGGQPMKTSTPLGVLDMIPLASFFSYTDTMIGSATDLFNGCNS